jgi:thioredoxin 1
MKYRAWIGKKELQEILGRHEPCFLLFAADWCGYCRRFLQIVNAYPTEDSVMDLLVVDIDSEDESLWDQYDVSLVPTIVIYKDGKEIFRKDGRPGIGLREADLKEAVSFARN